MEREEQKRQLKITLIEAYSFHKEKGRFIYHHEVRAKEIRTLYDSMFSDFDEVLIDHQNSSV